MVKLNLKGIKKNLRIHQTLLVILIRMKMFKNIILLLRALTGFHNTEDGSTCEVSRVWWDVHDYFEHKGGDGYPSHFFHYDCTNCGTEFSI
jgi:hypothetical protein